MRVFFSGLTAAGKTTHSRLLARRMGCHWLGATEMLAELTGVEFSDGEALWQSDAGRLINRAREGDVLDEQLDRVLLERVSREADIVVDAWAMPWLWKDEGVRVWLDSTPASRVLKCQVTQATDSMLSLDETADFLHLKDESTRSRFMRMYEFDLFHDHDVFDVILDNSSLIDEATAASAARGIRRFDPVVTAAVRWASGRAEADDAAVLDAAEDLIIRVKGWRT